MWRVSQQRKAVGVNSLQDYNLIREFEVATLSRDGIIELRRIYEGHAHKSG
jgi:hypothetical protein